MPYELLYLDCIYTSHSKSPSSGNHIFLSNPSSLMLLFNPIELPHISSKQTFPPPPLSHPTLYCRRIMENPPKTLSLPICLATPPSTIPPSVYYIANHIPLSTFLPIYPNISLIMEIPQ